MLRLYNRIDEQHALVRNALRLLGTRGVRLFYTLQNLAEFWNVCTRPMERNGLAMQPAQVRQALDQIVDAMSWLEDGPSVPTIWLDLVTRYQVRGVQVHDARLVANMKAHGVDQILTFNTVDFERYDGIQAIHPRDILGS